MDVHLPLTRDVASFPKTEAVVTEGAVVQKDLWAKRGPKTQCAVLLKKPRVLRNGPMGVFEWDALLAEHRCWRISQRM